MNIAHGLEVVIKVRIVCVKGRVGGNRCNAYGGKPRLKGEVEIQCSNPTKDARNVKMEPGK